MSSVGKLVGGSLALRLNTIAEKAPVRLISGSSLYSLNPEQLEIVPELALPPGREDDSGPADRVPGFSSGADISRTFRAIYNNIGDRFHRVSPL